MWNIATTEYPDFPSSWVIDAVTGRRWAWEVSNQSRVTLTKKTEILLVLTGCFEVSHWSSITGDILFWKKRQNLPLTQYNLVRKQRPEKNIILCFTVGAAAEVPEKWGLPAMLTLFSESQAELIFSVYLEFKNLPTVVGGEKKKNHTSLQHFSEEQTALSQRCLQASRQEELNCQSVCSHRPGLKFSSYWMSQRTQDIHCMNRE